MLGLFEAYVGMDIASWVLPFMVNSIVSYVLCCQFEFVC